jgi:hypothetical protein
VCADLVTSACSKLVGNVYVHRSSERTNPYDILYQKDTHSISLWVSGRVGLLLRKLTVCICWHLLLEANTIQCQSFILHVCLYLISRFLIVEFQRMCSGAMTDAATVYRFQNNLFSKAGKAGCTPMANAVCERLRWSQPGVAALLP